MEVHSMWILIVVLVRWDVVHASGGHCIPGVQNCPAGYEFPAQYQRLWNWGLQFGLISPYLRPIELNSRGYGLQATTRIPAHSVVLNIPRKLWLCSNAAVHTSIDTLASELETVDAFRRLASGFKDNWRLTLRLLYHKYISDQSFWFEYINSLPSDPGFHPLLLSPEGMEELQKARDEVADSFSETHDAFTTVEPEIQLLCSALITDAGMREAICGATVVKWAYVTASTRSWKTPSSHVCFFPFADFLNHDPSGPLLSYKFGNWSTVGGTTTAGPIPPQALAAASSAREAAAAAGGVSTATTAAQSLPPLSSAAQFTAERPYEAGEEFRISYGTRWTNGDTLVHYGFIIPRPSSHASALLLSCPFPPLPGSQLTPRQLWRSSSPRSRTERGMGLATGMVPEPLIKLGLAQGCFALAPEELLLLPDGNFHPKFMRCLRIRLLATGDALSMMRTYGPTLVTPPGGGAPVLTGRALHEVPHVPLSLENEWACVRVLAQFARRAISTMRSTAEEDNQLMRTGKRAAPGNGGSGSGKGGSGSGSGDNHSLAGAPGSSTGGGGGRPEHGAAALRRVVLDVGAVEGWGGGSSPAGLLRAIGYMRSSERQLVNRAMRRLRRHWFTLVDGVEFDAMAAEPVGRGHPGLYTEGGYEWWDHDERPIPAIPENYLSGSDIVRAQQRAVRPAAATAAAAVTAAAGPNTDAS